MLIRIKFDICISTLENNGFCKQQIHTKAAEVEDHITESVTGIQVFLDCYHLVPLFSYSSTNNEEYYVCTIHTYSLYIHTSTKVHLVKEILSN